MNERYLVVGAVLVALAGFLAFRLLRSRAPLRPMSEWLTVTFDDTQVTMSAQPPGKQPWEQSFLWADVIRVCFKSEGLLASDGVYIFTSRRPESFVIPIEANGGSEFWSKVVERGLFPPELAIKAAALPEGALSCWPALEGRA
ncbi:MAG: hypothetical protein ACK5VR_08615 [Burkholderiales bacterium]